MKQHRKEYQSGEYWQHKESRRNVEVKLVLEVVIERRRKKREKEKRERKERKKREKERIGVNQRCVVKRIHF